MSQALDDGDGAAHRPLYVDLDGTLVATDTLWESLFSLLRQQPLRALAAPAWLAAGKAGFKRRLASCVTLDAATLPYREELLAFLAKERQRGRPVYLATASDESVARAVVEHLDVFDGMLASDGERNLAGAEKVAAIRAHRGGEAFDYVGNSSADIPVWEAAEEVYAVGPSAALLRRLGDENAPERVFPGPSGGPRDLVRALRPLQWAKNLLIFVPLALTPHAVGDLTKLSASLVAFVALCLCASAGYVLNDLLDLTADRHHPEKRHRPFASGALQLPTGLVLVVLLAGAGFGIAVLGTPHAYQVLLAVYFLTSLSYSIYFKRLLLLDVIFLAGLYTLRVIAGAAAVSITLTPWLLAFSMFIFLSLAFGKRYSELVLMAEQQRSTARGRAYRVEDLDVVLTLGSTSGYLSVLVLCLYINSDVVSELYRTVEALWMLVPILLYWISRIWFLAKRGELPGDPVSFAVRDPVSLATGALMALVIGIAVL